MFIILAEAKIHIMQVKNYSIAKYNPKKEVILSNEIIENCRYSLSTQGFMLLMGLSQSIDYTREIWPEFEIEISGLFNFLNLKKDNGKRYDNVRLAFENIIDNPLKIRRSAKSWAGIPWLSYDYDEAISTRVRVKFHQDVMPYLLAFKNAIGANNNKGYTKMLPEFYQRFESKYATWLYPFFKKWQNTSSYKTIVVKKEIQWIREKTFTEKEYTRINDWLRYVLNMAVNEINEKSDLYILPIDKVNNNIKAEGKGKKYTHVYFYIDTKKNHKNRKKNDIQLKVYHSEDEIKQDYNEVERLTAEQINGIKTYQGKTLGEAARDRGKTLVNIGEYYYFCK